MMEQDENIAPHLLSQTDSTDASSFEKALADLRDVHDRLANQHDYEISLLRKENLNLSCSLQDRSRSCILDAESEVLAENGTTHLAKDFRAAIHQDDVILQERVEAGVDTSSHPRVRADIEESMSPTSSSYDLKLDSSKAIMSEDFSTSDNVMTTNSGLGEEFLTLAHRAKTKFEAGQACRTQLNSYFTLKECWVSHLGLAHLPADQILSIGEQLWCQSQVSFTSNSRHVRHPLWSRTTHGRTSSVSSFKLCLQRITVHPFSRRKMFWSLLGVLLLAYDFITLPVDFCFDADITRLPLQYVARFYWTLDILLNFLTAVYVKGVLIREPKFIAFNYLRSWLLFDVLLVLVEWISLAFMDRHEASVVSTIRAVRWARMLRFMSVMHFVRLTRIKPLVFEYIGHSSEDFAVFTKFACVTLGLIACTHVIACLWHLVGDSDHGGWVHRNAVTGSVAYRYGISLQIVLGRIHGARGVYDAGTHTEIALDIIFLILCFIGSALYIGLTTQVVICWANSDSAQLQKLAEKFVFRHRVSRKVDRKTRNFLSACRLQGIGEMLADERKFLRVLPIPLQEDLQYESRAPVLATIPYLLDLNYANPRVMRHLCYHALTDNMSIQNETVFAPGDPCRCAIFVADGKLLYKCGNTMTQVVSPSSVSEAILWTCWEHNGTLKAEYDTLLLYLDAEKFAQSIIGHKLACAHAVKYARVFVYRLNHSDVTDITHFMDLDLESLDEAAHQLGSDEVHLMFLSHYKAEAGTEATLMRDALEQILNMDPSYHSLECVSPVFVDSEDLVDLTRLKSHVEGSGALVLLLTPNLFTRPWCLFEISTAFRKDIRIVPVELQRPGAKYQYPDESFFQRFEAGLILSAHDQKLLEDNGFAIHEVVAIMRHVFKKIALPFSPHKSWNVRRAELTDILKRCIGGNGKKTEAVQAMHSKVLSFPSTSTNQLEQREVQMQSSERKNRRTFKSVLNEETGFANSPSGESERTSRYTKKSFGLLGNLLRG